MIAVRPKEEEMKVQRSLFVTQSKAACSADESEMDQDSAGSSEEMESPRSVGRWRRPKKMAYVHSQILRIREEDSHLGESSFSAKEKVPSRLDLVLFARPILPSSPLKNTVNALH
ncbi:hypothetical protein M0R45_033439 [Rubus argutus]|uniref:Uncharacterized protein n=1 Tax=Rubus argutus TaxID=59490 RepID=A0AAW1WLR9_RUBAR